MSYLEDKARRIEKDYPPREDGKKCGNCANFKSCIQLNRYGGWQSGLCVIMPTTVFDFQYCNKHVEK